jgi:hypothetical protein
MNAHAPPAIIPPIITTIITTIAIVIRLEPPIIVAAYVLPRHTGEYALAAR